VAEEYVGPVQLFVKLVGERLHAAVGVDVTRFVSARPVARQRDHLACRFGAHFCQGTA